jgi:hypothetical protein
MGDANDPEETRRTSIAESGWRPTGGLRVERIDASDSGLGLVNFGGMRPRSHTNQQAPVEPPALISFLESIRRAFNIEAFAPALISALVLPDACGAVEYPDAANPRNRNRYVQWYDRFIPAVVHEGFRFGGEAAWKVRNGMIHETGLQFSEFGYDRVIFMPPGPISLGAGFMRNMGDSGRSAFVLELGTFLQDVVRGAEAWLDEIKGDVAKQNRLRSLIHYRAEGLPPFLVGVPAIY